MGSTVIVCSYWPMERGRERCHPSQVITGNPWKRRRSKGSKLCADPATLLYGSSAIGGVVNVISRNQSWMSTRTTACEVTSPRSAAQQTEWRAGMPDLSTAWDRICCGADGGSQRTGDYRHADRQDSQFGYQNDANVGRSCAIRRNMHFGRELRSARWQVRRSGAVLNAARKPTAFPDSSTGVKIDWRRHNARLHGGLRNMSGWVESFRGTVNFSDWKHAEIESGEIGTRFHNRQYTFNGVAQQQKRGIFSGSFGAWGMLRDFKSVGAEALARQSTRSAAAVFSVQELNFDRFRLQFGGRVERNAYTAQGARSRSFTGFSGAAGINVPLWKSAAVVFNYTSSYRAPALEELYNNGPHLGNLAFEIGNPNLNRDAAMA